MPAPYGLQSTGFSLKTFEDIKTELENRIYTIFGPTAVAEASSQFAQLIAAFGEMLATNWQGQQALYNAGDPRTNTGISLDNMSSLVNLVRKIATQTQVVVRFSGTNGTVVPATTTQVSVNNGELFYTSTSGTVSGGFVDILCYSVNYGDIKGFANTITVLNTPISGITTVNNPADPTVQGQDLESDDRFRARRNATFQALGRDSVTAIRAALLGLTGVTDAYVFENYSDTTDASGLPPHSFEAVLSGGVDATIAATLYTLKRSGIATHGTTTVSVTDSQGISLPIKFSRPSNVTVYMTVNVIADASTFPANGGTLIRDSILTFLQDDVRQGTEIRASRYIPYVFKVDGVLEVSMPLIGLSASPTLSDTLVFDTREKPVITAGNINVNGVLQVAGAGTLIINVTKV